VNVERELLGKVAIVTGAARNIGRGIALDLAQAGASVVVNAKSSADAAEETTRLIREAGTEALVHLADVTVEAEARGLVSAAVARFGGVDVLVINVAVRRETKFPDMDYREWREVLSVILDGTYFCTRVALAALQASGGGSIVNIGGMSAHTGAAHRAHVVTAKAGLVGLTRALAHDLAPYGVTVNCVVPGMIDTMRGASATGAGCVKTRDSVTEGLARIAAGPWWECLDEPFRAVRGAHTGHLLTEPPGRLCNR
jgi:3-oxoacyl-[acyl-carrier protein] reductase